MVIVGMYRDWDIDESGVVEVDELCHVVNTMAEVLSAPGALPPLVLLRGAGALKGCDTLSGTISSM